MEAGCRARPALRRELTLLVPFPRSRWAYVIGSTVAIAAALQAKDQAHRLRIDRANELIERIHSSAEAAGAEAEDGMGSVSSELTRRGMLRNEIRAYIRTKHLRGRDTPSSADIALVDNFEILQQLPAHLMRRACLEICRAPLEHSRFLSSAQLDDGPRSFLATKARIQSYGAGSRLAVESPADMGIYHITLGSGLASLPGTGRATPVLRGSTFGHRLVLVERDHPMFRSSDLVVSFTSYTELLLIPRDAIEEVLQQHPEVWRRCARWHYACVLLHYTLRRLTEERGIC